MAAKIRVLDEETINKIAAGEVIENAASVVKELVDNAIDAGATEITIDIREGGRQLIRVTDNGCGMNSDDAVLCLERHATSKIRSVDEIFSTTTMGFRGEAIPSIASISKFTLLTRSQDADEEQGTLVIVEGGKLIKVAPAACAAGTTLEVKSLFFNLPVRRKFQKSPAYDTQEIVKLITWLALTYPQVHFKLNESPKMLLSTPLGSVAGTLQEQLAERIKILLGDSFSDAIVPIQAHSGEFQLAGFIGIPSHHRPNRTGQYLCINKRPVFFSPLIGSAIKEGYGTMLPAQRYPVYVLHFTLPGELVDANVHPQKREVRLRQEHALKDFLRQAVLDSLQPSSRPRFDPPSEAETPVIHDFGALPEPIFNFSLPFPKEEDLSDLPPIPTYAQIHSTALPSPHIFTQASKPLPTAPSQLEQLLLPEVIATLPGFLMIGRLNSHPYTLVDQTAARARIIFDQLSSTSSVASQHLLIPHPISLTPVEATLLESHLASLHTLGFSIQTIGPSSFMLDALPQSLSTLSIDSLMRDLVAALQDKSAHDSVQERIAKKLAALAARHASEKRNLSMEEGKYLLKQLFSSTSPHFCPHGRPILAPFHLEDFQRFFNLLAAKGPQCP